MSETTYRVPANSAQRRKQPPIDTLSRNDAAMAVAAISLTVALVTGTCWLVCHCM